MRLLYPLAAACLFWACTGHAPNPFLLDASMHEGMLSDASPEDPQVDALEGGRDATEGQDTVSPPHGDGSPPTPPEPLFSCTRTLSVPAQGALERALADVRAGDCLELADGSYKFPSLKTKGRRGEPVVIRAKNLLAARVESGDL